MADAVLEGGPVEQRHRQHVHRVEPAAGLGDVLDDEVARIVPLEPDESPEVVEVFADSRLASMPWLPVFEHCNRFSMQQ